VTLCGLEAVEGVSRVRGSSGFRITRPPGPGCRLVIPRMLRLRVGDSPRATVWLGFPREANVTPSHPLLYPAGYRDLDDRGFLSFFLRSGFDLLSKLLRKDGKLGSGNANWESERVGELDDARLRLCNDRMKQPEPSSFPLSRSGFYPALYPIVLLLSASGSIVLLPPRTPPPRVGTESERAKRTFSCASSTLLSIMDSFISPPLSFYSVAD